MKKNCLDLSLVFSLDAGIQDRLCAMLEWYGTTQSGRLHPQSVAIARVARISRKVQMTTQNQDWTTANGRALRLQVYRFWKSWTPWYPPADQHSFYLLTFLHRWSSGFPVRTVGYVDSFPKAHTLDKWRPLGGCEQILVQSEARWSWILNARISEWLVEYAPFQSFSKVNWHIAFFPQVFLQPMPVLEFTNGMEQHPVSQDQSLPPAAPVRQLFLKDGGPSHREAIRKHENIGIPFS